MDNSCKPKGCISLCIRRCINYRSWFTDEDRASPNDGHAVYTAEKARDDPSVYMNH